MIEELIVINQVKVGHTHPHVQKKLKKNFNIKALKSSENFRQKTFIFSKILICPDQYLISVKA